MHLFGASGHAKVIIDILNQCDEIIESIFDDNSQIDNLLNYSVCLPTVDSLSMPEGPYIVTIGDNATRKVITKRFILKYGVAIHPRSTIAANVHVGEGSVVMANATINASSTIGNHTIINTSSIVEHDTIVEDYSHISPNACLCGSVIVGNGTHIGAGAVVLPGIRIGRSCIIGAGSVVVQDIPSNSIAFGNPARVVKELNL